MSLPGRTRTLLRLALLAVPFLAGCTGVAFPQRTRPAAAEAVPAVTAAEPDDDLGADACAEQHRQTSRRLEGPWGERLKGPAPDRRDIAYGTHPRQRLDVFLPRPASAGGLAPVIVMVHGGGWCVGDKSMKSVTAHKVAHWVPRGFLLVSVNYPMLTDGRDALAQAEEVARAIAYVQQHARSWGGDGRRVVLMGHSAGAHLVSLVNADGRLRSRMDVRPVLGTVSIDSGAIHTVMQMRSLRSPQARERYLEAFGRDESSWRQASPWHQLDRTAAPWLGICSTRRSDDPCAQARAYADKSRSLGVAAEVRPVDRSHRALNEELGVPGPYTEAVDRFIASIEPSLRGPVSR